MPGFLLSPLVLDFYQEGSALLHHWEIVPEHVNWLPNPNCTP
jgi:hypothetical protein